MIRIKLESAYDSIVRKLREKVDYADLDEIRNQSIELRISQYAHLLIRLDSAISRYRDINISQWVAISDQDLLLLMLNKECRLGIKSLTEISFQNAMSLLSKFIDEGDYDELSPSYAQQESSCQKMLIEQHRELVRYDSIKELVPELSWNNPPFDVLGWKLIP